MNIAIFGRLTKTTRFDVLGEFFAYLQTTGVQASILASYAEELRTHGLDAATSGIRRFDTLSDMGSPDFVYSIGGDGTILDAVRFIAHANIPILGVNAGRLGFLASVNQQELQTATADLIVNAWKPDVRSLLSITAKPNPVFADFNCGLNEITVHKALSNEMITVHTFVNGEFLNSYWTDGLIVSTPTGSTAYSLACGGPILSPKTPSFVLTPIAPHSLTVRPMVIPDSAVISFAIESRSGQALVALDNRTELIADSTELAVRRADVGVTLVRLPSRGYFSTLRSRLSWGLDTRG